jgi:hypothetical protein
VSIHAVAFGAIGLGNGFAGDKIGHEFRRAGFFATGCKQHEGYNT